MYFVIDAIIMFSVCVKKNCVLKRKEEEEEDEKERAVRAMLY